MEDEERSRVMVHLNRLSGELSEASIKASCAVMVSKSVAECIANYASQEGVDLIAMYTRGRTGLAKLLKGSVTAGFGDIELKPLPTHLALVLGRKPALDQLN